MRNYSKWIAGVFCALALFATTAAAATNEQASLFNAGETGVSLSSGYNVIPGSAFQDEYSWNVSVGVYHWATKNFGIEANLPISFEGTAVQEVQAGVLARLPVTTNVPLFKNFAPYIGLGSVANWKTDEAWAYVAKGGIEWRANAKWGVFCEYQYRNIDFDWNDGETRLQAGLKFSF